VKKFMIRGKRRRNYMPKSLKYGTWYDFVTPFDWQYFKIKKSSRYVSIYDFINNKKPQYTVTKKRFLEEVLPWAKSSPRPAEQEKL